MIIEKYNKTIKLSKTNSGTIFISIPKHIAEKMKLKDHIKIEYENDSETGHIIRLTK